MHEAGLMKALMRGIETVAREEKARRVVKISVWLGALSHMSPAHFNEHFEDSARGTLAEGAEVECHVSDDIHDPRAQDVVLEGVEVET